LARFDARGARRRGRRARVGGDGADPDDPSCTLSPLDPPTQAGVPALRLLVAALACCPPSRRAMTIDPVNALRN